MGTQFWEYRNDTRPSAGYFGSDQKFHFCFDRPGLSLAHFTEPDMLPFRIIVKEKINSPSRSPLAVLLIRLASTFVRLAIFYTGYCFLICGSSAARLHFHCCLRPDPPFGLSTNKNLRPNRNRRNRSSVCRVACALHRNMGCHFVLCDVSPPSRLSS